MLSPVMGARRSVIEIVYEMLTACNNDGIKKTAIMYRCSLSYAAIWPGSAPIAWHRSLPDHLQGTGDPATGVDGDPDSVVCGQLA